MENRSMSENLNKNQFHSVKGKNGGARPGAGRKKGSVQKLSAQSILHEIAKKDKPFAIGLAEDYHNARMSGDQHLVVKYQQMILNKVVADKVDVDHTTLGQPIQTIFNFPQKELVDWTPEVSFKYESSNKD
jgi:hypothetical protein